MNKDQLVKLLRELAEQNEREYERLSVSREVDAAYFEGKWIAFNRAANIVEADLERIK
jgi:hypothetical protein